MDTTLVNTTTMCNQILMNCLNFSVLALTLLTVIWYTIITHRLHATAQKQLIEITKQRRLSIVPTLLPELKRAGVNNNLSVRNIGNGVALNICFDKVYYAPDLKSTYFEFNEIPMLRQSESVVVSHRCYLEGSLREADGTLAQLTSEYATSPVVIRFTFFDLAGDQYEQKFQMGKGEHKHISFKLIGRDDQPSV